jgi:ATP phosphoribosyltransferase
VIAALKLALPSKGRLQEQTNAYFSRAGLRLRQGRGAREYRAQFDGYDEIEILYLSAAEIAGELSRGGAHLGVTGEDLVREIVPFPKKRVLLLHPLGFGNADVVVAVPRTWIDVLTMRDLVDVAAMLHATDGKAMRVATKYTNITRSFFERHGVAEYCLVPSSGATEGAPAAGSADIIVDITTTGATLAENGLRVVSDGKILSSQAYLVGSLSANWSEVAITAARRLTQRLEAERNGRSVYEVQVQAAVDPDMFRCIPEVFKTRYLDTGQRDLVSFTAADDTAHQFCDWLLEHGANRVTMRRYDFIYHRVSTLWDRLDAELHGVIFKGGS